MHTTNKTSLSWIYIYVQSAKLIQGKNPTDAVEVARSKLTRRKDKEDPTRVASRAQLPRNSDAQNGRATGLMPVPGVDFKDQ